MINDKLLNKQPINNIKWILAEELAANDYNPNIVYNTELKLLEHSIMTTGWVQPILVSKDNVIIDGFHRVQLSLESKKIKERFNGYVPCSILNLSVAEAKCLTIRINRAKGTHVAVRMADIVQDLHDNFSMDFKNIAAEIGATPKEVELLYENSIFKHKDIKKYKYSKAWKPVKRKSYERPTKNGV
ncbi:MAG: hypothetical protein Unbinned4311contig1001_35 [Prokaryotic dsDNA virus sp.]|nr:MAG: hypothetical protein Unbinned4311contig1001_35 [Prokaryotic dsDNA virus sp.]|tara:strand:+ start:481 stop:1038 length:558 start_codon:yes stop_codon:yes gene_type:complete